MRQHDTSDKIEYNVSLTNDKQTNPNENNIPCILSDTLERRFLPNNLQDYQVAISGLIIPTFDLPIFKFQLYEPDPYDPSKNLNDSDVIAIDFGLTPTRVVSVQQYVIFISRDRIGNPNIYQISQYIQMLNTTVLSIFTILDADYVTLSGSHLPGYVAPGSWTTLPVFYFDKLTQRIRLEASQAEWEDLMVLPDVNGKPQGKGGRFNMYCNKSCFQKFTGVDAYTTGIHWTSSVPPNSGMDFRVIFHNNYDNVISGKLVNTQQWTSFANMSDFVSMQVLTNMPIQTQFSGKGNINTVLLEIHPLDIGMDTYHQNLSYNVVFPYKWRDIISPMQVSDIWFKIFYTTSSSVSPVPLLIPPNTTATIKLIFQKKVTSNY
jgi:hypothetical protein